MGIVELLAVVEQVRGISKLANAFAVALDTEIEKPYDEISILRSYGKHGIQDESKDILKDVQVVESGRLGIDHVPNIWRVLAQYPALLQTNWLKDGVILREAGVLGVRVKLLVALGTAMCEGSPYFVNYYSRTIEKKGLDERAVLEVAATMYHSTCFNTFADGMQIEPESAELDYEKIMSLSKRKGW